MALKLAERPRGRGAGRLRAVRVGLWSVAHLALALLSGAPARADCFLNGATITCTPPGTTGYSNATGDGFNLTVQSGTTLIDDGTSAILLRDGNTVTNNGTIAAGDLAAGIVVDDDNTIWNNATITAGAGGAGISGGNRNTVTNAGSISVGDGFGGYGIAVGVDNTIVNSGTITVGQGATGIAADVNTSLPASNSVTNSGSINVGDFGMGIVVTDNHRVLNSGSIVAGTATIGVMANNNNVINNTGTITVGAAGIGVQLVDVGNTLNNYGTIKATGSGYSIETCACSAINNTINNMAGGTLDGYFNVDGSGNTLTNSGLITVTDPATGLIGYPTFLLANTALTGAGNSFVQTASGTLALRMNNAGLVDNLSADAITARGTLKVVIQSQLYQNTTFSGTAVGLTAYGAGTLGNTVTSGFDRYVASSPFFTVTPIYDTGNASSYTSLSLRLDRLGFGSVAGMTSNQQAVGNALEQGYSSSLDPNSGIGQFYLNLFGANSVSVLDQLSGAGTTGAQSASFNAGSQFNSAILQQGFAWLTGAPSGTSVTTGAPLGYAAPTPAERMAGHEAFAAMRPRAPEKDRWRAWGAAFGATRKVTGDSGGADQSTRTAGGAFGVDRQIGSDLLLGFAAGGSGSTFTVSDLSTSGRTDGGHVGVYGVKTFGQTYLAAMLNYARFDNSTERTITGVGTSETAKGGFNSDLFGGRLEIGWRRSLGNHVVTPFAAIEPSVLRQQAYTETSTTSSGGGGTLGLSYASHTTTSLPTFLGAQIDTRYVLDGGQVLSPSMRLSWVHEFKPDRQIEASLATLGSPSFTVDGARAARDALRTDIGVTLALAQNTALFASFNGEFSNTSTMVAGTAGARLNW